MVRTLLVAAVVGCTAVEPLDGPAGRHGDPVGDPAPDESPLPPDEQTPGAPYIMDGFSFVDDHVAGLPQPGRRVPLDDDLGFLADEGIALLVSLTVEPTSPDAVADHGMDLLHLPIADFQPPTLEQQLQWVEAVQERVDAGERVGVHCTAGLGRTGTMLATWFVAAGWEPQESIDHVRELRPGSIETADQEASVFQFAEAQR